MDNRLDFKSRIYSLQLSRKVLAARLNISYNGFSLKLCGFQNFTPEQESQLRHILDEAEKTQSTTGQKDAPYYVF
jgi:hypothetical protein